MAIDETELMAVLAPKFDEIYKMIAELKNEEEVEDIIEEEMIPTQLSTQEKFAQFVAFSKKNK
jgi:siderophore synthetase component